MDIKEDMKRARISYKGSVDSADSGEGGSHGSVVVERKGKVVVELQIQWWMA